MQNAAFAALDRHARYVALRAWRELVEPLMRSVAGGNVTLPHKLVAAAALDRPSDAVRATGACNVFWWEQGRGLCGDNTDVAAFRAAAGAVLGSDLSGCSVLLLGAGGAARAVAYACLQDGAERVAIFNRTSEKARSLIDELGAPAALSEVDRAAGDYDLVVNATSLGLLPTDTPPIVLREVRTKALLDLVYSRDETALVRAARDAGVKATDGRRMLLEQAAASVPLWFGLEAPREVMEEALMDNV
jgi:shikimate dehydrogenase